MYFFIYQMLYVIKFNDYFVWYCVVLFRYIFFGVLLWKQCSSYFIINNTKFMIWTYWQILFISFLICRYCKFIRNLCIVILRIHFWIIVKEYLYDCLFLPSFSCGKFRILQNLKFSHVKMRQMEKIYFLWTSVFLLWYFQVRLFLIFKK